MKTLASGYLSQQLKQLREYLQIKEPGDGSY